MAKTLDAIRSQANNPDAIVEAGEVVDMRFPAGTTLSLRAAKLFHLLVQAAGVTVADPKQHRMTFASLNETFRISIPDLEGLVDELHSTILKLHLTDQTGRSYVKSGPILSDVEREDETLAQAELRFEFSPHYEGPSRTAPTGLSFQEKRSWRLKANTRYGSIQFWRFVQGYGRQAKTSC